MNLYYSNSKIMLASSKPLVDLYCFYLMVVIMTTTNLNISHICQNAVENNSSLSKPVIIQTSQHAIYFSNISTNIMLFAPA